jgi:hypothetical protein
MPHDEIQRLQRTLHEHNPFRSVKLMTIGPNGARVLVKEGGRLNVNETSIRNRQSLIFERISLRELFLFELWIDGGCAVRFRDLSFHYINYSLYPYENSATYREQLRYYATIEARDAAGDDDIGLIIEFNVRLSPEDHARLLQRDSIMEFTPPPQLSNNRYVAERGAEEEIPISCLSEDWVVSRKLTFLSHMCCSASFFFRHLTVPYVPYE